MRKTFNVEEFKVEINEQLQHSTTTPGFRRGLISALEDVLHLTGNYKGWKILTEDEVPENQRPGIRLINGWDEISFEDCDDTRRRYY